MGHKVASPAHFYCPAEPAGTHGIWRKPGANYAHVYFIPLFPFAKSAVAQCRSCLLKWEGKKLPAEVRESIHTIKRQTRLPLWTWSGTAVLAALIGWGEVANTQDDRANAAYLAAPRSGDIYTVRSTDKKSDYSLLKVVGVKGKTVDVVANEYQINNSHPIDKLNAPAKYGKESFALSQFELEIMKNKGQLTDVDRLEE